MKTILHFQFKRFYTSKINIIFVSVMLAVALLLSFLFISLSFGFNTIDNSSKNIQTAFTIINFMFIAFMTLFSILTVYSGDIDNGIIKLENRMGLKKTLIFFSRFLFIQLNNLIITSAFFVFLLLITSLQKTIFINEIILNLLIVQAISIAFSLFFGSILLLFFTIFKNKVSIGIASTLTVLFTLSVPLLGFYTDSKHFFTATNTKIANADNDSEIYYELKMIDYFYDNPDTKLIDIYNDLFKYKDSRITYYTKKQAGIAALYYDGLLEGYVKNVKDPVINIADADGKDVTDDFKNSTLFQFGKSFKDEEFSNEFDFFDLIQGSPSTMRRKTVGIMKSFDKLDIEGNFLSKKDINFIIKLCKEYYKNVLYKYYYYDVVSNTMHNQLNHFTYNLIEDISNLLNVANSRWNMSAKNRLISKILLTLMYDTPENLENSIQDHNNSYKINQKKLNMLALKSMFNPLTSFSSTVSYKPGDYNLRYNSMMYGIYNISDLNSYYINFNNWKLTSTDFESLNINAGSKKFYDEVKYSKYPIYTNIIGLTINMLETLALIFGTYKLWIRKLD